MRSRPVGRFGIAAACLVLLVGLAPSTSAYSGPTQERHDGDQVLEQVRRELAESSEEMVRAAADMRRAELALPGARRVAAEARSLLADARRREARAAHRRGVAQTRLMLATQGTEAVAAQVDEQRARMGRLARAVYQRGGTLADVSMLLEASSAADFTERLAALRSVVTSQRSALGDLRALETTYGAREAGLERIRDEVAAAHEEAQAELAAVAELEERARAAEAEVLRLATSRREALAAARAALAEDSRRLLVLQGESSRLGSRLGRLAEEALGPGGVQAGSTVPPQPGTLAWPVHAPVTSPFGIRVHPITGERKLHTGTDLGAACGTPIRAARDGTVLEAGYNRAYGWRTVLSHGVVGGVLLTTTYNHQQDLGVRTGQRIDAGQVIGVVGSTGYSTGCHLHFELVVNADLVDPMPWMAAG